MVIAPVPSVRYSATYSLTRASIAAETAGPFMPTGTVKFSGSCEIRIG
jgi:hypothetical protein